MKIDLLEKAYLGMGLSRYTGFEFMKCVNVDDYGVIKLNYKPYAQAVKDGESFSAMPLQIGYGRSSATAFIRFMIASGAIKYWHASNAEWTAVASPGTTSYDSGFGFYAGSQTKDFLIYRSSTSTNLNALDCSSTVSPSIDTGFVTTLESGALYQPFFTASNNRLYIGNRRYVAELYENDGQTFDPATSATFTFTAKKLDLPASFEVSCLDEWTDYLVVGTKNSQNPNVSSLFLYDKVSPSYERTINVNVPGGINQLIVHKGYIYFQAGNKGEWFVSAGGAAEKVAQIPSQLVPRNTSVTTYNNSRAVIGDRIYFGAAISDNGLCGLWSFDTRLIGESFDPVNRGVQPCQLEHTISTGNTNACFIGGLQAVGGEGLLYGWNDATATSYGIDEINVTGSGRTVYSGSEGKVITKYYQLSGLGSKALSSELHLAKPIKSGESINIYIRSNANSTYEITATGWAVDTSYTSGTSLVINNGRMYECINSHTSSATDEPGTGVDWKIYWQESWKLYKSITSTDYLSEKIITCPKVDSINAKHIQFMYILDTGAGVSTGPEMLSHLLYD